MSDKITVPVLRARKREGPKIALVTGHVGLTPQSVHAFGGFRVEGKEEDAAARALQDAKSLEQACVPGPEHSFGMATPNSFGVPTEARPVVAQVPPAYGRASGEES